MKVAVFSTKPYDRRFLDAANAVAGLPHELVYLECRLDEPTAALAAGAEAVCVFVNDRLNHRVLAALAGSGTRLAALRAAGFNNVDLAAARDLGVAIARVPAYSPESVAEHVLALILALDRKICRASARVREGNFSLEGLIGFNLHGRTFGIVGTGRIGTALARILSGFGCRIVASDPIESKEVEALGGRYVTFGELIGSADIVSLHCPLTPQTRHLIDASAIGRIKPGVMLINTSRGAVVDARALIAGLKSGVIGFLGLDVYEEEGDLFFEDLSDRPIRDDVFARLLTFPNVLITGHQGFFTIEAMQSIATTTIANLSQFERTGRPLHAVTTEDHLCQASGAEGGERAGGI